MSWLKLIFIHIVKTFISFRSALFFDVMSFAGKMIFTSTSGQSVSQNEGFINV